MPIEPKSVRHPKHYTEHPSGIECIEITRHFNFCLGNAIKYIWRADLKGHDIEDLQKAKQYIDFEIDRRTKRERELLKCIDPVDLTMEDICQQKKY
jgi:hypothetical protein